MSGYTYQHLLDLFNREDESNLDFVTLGEVELPKQTVGSERHWPGLPNTAHSDSSDVLIVLLNAFTSISMPAPPAPPM